MVTSRSTRNGAAVGTGGGAGWQEAESAGNNVKAAAARQTIFFIKEFSAR
jgi:hypothetical protein